MQIVEVKQKTDWSLFYRVPAIVYKNDPNWIAPLQMEIKAVFNPEENKAFQHGQAQAFVLMDANKKPIGRIAAFIDTSEKEAGKLREGGLGFFECIENAEAAAALFKAGEDYLAQFDVQVIDGPINFGQRDKFWGLLVRGFEPALYQENYNPPYYEQFFLDAGYTPFEQILTYKGDTSVIPFKRLGAIAERLKQRQPMYVRAFSYDEADRFAKDFTEVYNASFGHFEHFNPIDEPVVKKMMEQAKPILDPELACIAYYDDKPAGFVVLYPDINPLIKHAKGKLNWRTIPAFLWKKSRAKTFNAKGMGFGIHPEYQSKGIFALLINYLGTDKILAKYPKMYLATIRTHNHEIRSIYAKLKVGIDRVHVTFRKAVDPSVKVTPFEFIDFSKEEATAEEA
ncbi:MAG: GNAT family N-acetyltransferase [Bacteroidota bacterium]